MFGWLTEKKVTYYRKVRKPRKSRKTRKTKIVREQERIISAAKSSKSRKGDKELIDLFRREGIEINPSKLNKGVRGLVRLEGKGRSSRLVIYT